MRYTILTAFIGLMLTGCLVGASRGETTTTHLIDNGDGRVRSETFTTKSSGTSVGGSVPLMMNASYGGSLGMAGSYYLPGGVLVRAAGSGSCDMLHPDYCAVIETATINQPLTIVSNGGGTAAKLDSREPTTGENNKLTKLLAKHEKRIAMLIDNSNLTSLRLCQLIVGIDEDLLTKVIKDQADRKQMVASCRQLLTENHASAPGKTGEKN